MEILKKFLDCIWKWLNCFWYTFLDHHTEVGPKLPVDLVMDPCNCDLSTARSDTLETEIEATKIHWSHLRSSDVLWHEKQSKQAAESNREVFRSLNKKWPDFFALTPFWPGPVVLGEKLGEGAQAEIYACDGAVVKVFKLEGVSLCDLQKQLPSGLFSKSNRPITNPYACFISRAELLDDGRFAISMMKFWGDLRKLIDLRMQYNHNLGPPFSYSRAYCLMWEIARGMLDLGNSRITHRDLKASNVLVYPCERTGMSESNGVVQIMPIPVDEFCPRHSNSFVCAVAHYEFSIGVVGTKFWRAPEILHALNDGSINTKPELFSERADVYSYAMTCYEILTGKYPFEGVKANDYEAVFSGRVQLEWPRDMEPHVKALLNRCSHLQPSRRPTFVEIINILNKLALGPEY